MYKGGLNGSFSWLFLRCVLCTGVSKLLVPIYIHAFLGIIVFCLALYTSMGFSWPLTSFLGLSSCPLGSFSSTY